MPESESRFKREADRGEFGLDVRYAPDFLDVRWKSGPHQVGGNERSLRACQAVDRAVVALIKAMRRANREAAR